MLIEIFIRIFKHLASMNLKTIPWLPRVQFYQAQYISEIHKPFCSVFLVGLVFQCRSNSIQFPFSLVLTNPFIRFNANCIRMWVISFLSFAMKNGYVNLRHFCKQYFLFIFIHLPLLSSPPHPPHIPHIRADPYAKMLRLDIFTNTDEQKKTPVEWGWTRWRRKEHRFQMEIAREVKSHFA